MPNTKANPNVSDNKTYTQSWNGQRFNGYLIRPDGSQVIARLTDVGFDTALSVTNPDEISVPYVQETNYGREEMTRGNITEVWSLLNNDNLPSWETIWGRDDVDMLMVLFVDTPNGRIVGDVVEGVKITNKGSRVGVNQQRYLNVGFLGRRKLSGAQYKALVNTGAYYPADTSSQTPSTTV